MHKINTLGSLMYLIKLLLKQIFILNQQTELINEEYDISTHSHTQSG